jgi:hypothetical protein
MCRNANWVVWRMKITLSGMYIDTCALLRDRSSLLGQNENLQHQRKLRRVVWLSPLSSRLALNVPCDFLVFAQRPPPYFTNTFSTSVTCPKASRCAGRLRESSQVCSRLRTKTVGNQHDWAKTYRAAELPLDIRHGAE